MIDNKENNFSPTYDEIINELMNVNSRLTLENTVLRITLEKTNNASRPDKEQVRETF